MGPKTADTTPRERAPGVLSARAGEVFTALCRLEQNDATEVVRQWVVLNAWEERQRTQAALQRPADGSIPDENAWREWYGDLGPVERELELLEREMSRLPKGKRRKRASDELMARWDALQVKRRAALGISEQDWNAADEGRKDDMLGTAYDRLYETRWRAQCDARRSTLDEARLRRFYDGENHIKPVLDFERVFSNAIALVRQSHIPPPLMARIVGFAARWRAARTTAPRNTKIELATLGRMIDVLLADALNPGREGKRGSGGARVALPPNYTKATRNRLSTASSDVKTTPWSKIAAIVGREGAEQLRAEWTGIMLDALDALDAIDPPAA
jgi:hypothetical protein